MSITAILTGMFWLGLFGALYAYIGFPALVALVSRRRPAPSASTIDGSPAERVTVVVPAYNEEASIGVKLRNVLSADYPRHLLDVIVVSDASTDRTNEVARTFEAEGVRLIVQEQRRGKTAGLNRALAIAHGQIVVFTDANAVYLPGTIRTLVGYLRNPRIGLVSGYTKYTMTQDGGVAEVTNVYTSLERIIKRGESRWGCCVGADGAVFAMRRGLYSTLRDDDINDFALPLRVIRQGYDCVFAEDAFCSENAGKNLESEFRRQSRITNRTLRGLWRNARLLNPIRFPLFSFFLFSHKVVRFFVPVFLILSAASLALLAPGGGFYAVAALAAALVIGLALLSKAWPQPASGRRPVVRILSLFPAFLTINVAVLDGWWKFLSGNADVTWQHDRSPVRR